MKYSLRIIKSQADHLGDRLPTQDYADRFDTVQEAADYAEALIAQHAAPPGAFTYEIVDGTGQPVEGYESRTV